MLVVELLMAWLLVLSVLLCLSVMLPMLKAFWLFSFCRCAHRCEKGKTSELPPAWLHEEHVNEHIEHRLRESS